MTPVAVANRPALPAIAYRIGSYAEFRESMLEAIARTPELASLTTRESDDYSVTVLELWAAVADVLTFYQERYANEAYLRTATQRASVARLARLIGYALRPGAAAIARLVFTVDEGKSFTVPVGLRVQSVPGQGEVPQTFESLESLVASAALNRLRILPAPIGVNPLAKGTTEALLGPGADGLAAAAALAPGDRFLLAAPGGALEELTVKAVRAEEERTRVSWEGPVQGAGWDASSTVFKFARVFRLFGHNAPATSMTPSADDDVPGGIRWRLQTTTHAYPQASAEYMASASTLLAALQLGPVATVRWLVLDGRYEKIAVGTRLLVARGNANSLVTVTAVDQVQDSLGGLSDTATRVAVTPGIPAGFDRRPVRVYELAEPQIPLWGYAYPDRIEGDAVYLPGRRLDGRTIELGRTIVRNAFEAGTRLSLDQLERGRAVLLGDAGSELSVAEIAEAAITGAEVRVAPTVADTAAAQRLRLAGGGAQAVTGLASEARPGVVDLTAATPSLAVTIGETGPRTISLGVTQATIGSFGALLEAGIRAADDDPGFTHARVVSVDDRIVVLPGTAGARVTIAPTAADPTTARELGLDAEHAHLAEGLLSGPPAFTLSRFTGLLGGALLRRRFQSQLSVSIGPVGPHTIAFPSFSDRARLAAAIQSALNAADPAPAFRRARVLVVGDCLLVLAGPVGGEIQEYLRLELAGPAVSLDAASAVLLGNVVRASHGETVHDEVVGNGDAAAAFQRLALAKKPLTYVPTSKGLESSLHVLVDGVQWTEAPTLYARGRGDRAYVARRQDDGTTLLQFGDGVTGARLPTGAANVHARYRTGIGLAGRVRAETLTTALDRPPGLKAVTNPLPAEGGADPEEAADARRNAPQTVRTFGRAISIRDFEDLVRESGEVAKARATWVWAGLERAVHLTVAGQEGGLFSDDELRRIGAAITAARDPNHRLRLANYAPVPVVVRANVIVEPDRQRDAVLAAARAAILDALSFDALQLGGRIDLSDVIRILQDVPGVLAVDVDELQFKRPADRSRNGNLDPVQPHLRVLQARPEPAHRWTVLPAELAVVETPADDVALVGSGGLIA